MVGSHRVVIALGSNLGDSSEVLDEAVAELGDLIENSKISSYYRTVPVGGPKQSDYLNAVVIGTTAVDPETLLSKVQDIELAHGRVRTVHWGPRTLDIDLIDYDGSAIESSQLTLPHPRAHTRAFVLVPWLEVDPEAVLPGYGPIAALLEKLDVSGVRRV